MGPLPQPTNNPYRPPQLDTNPNVRKGNAAEKRKRAVPTKRFRPSAAPKPSEAAVCPPVTNSKVPECRPPSLEKAPVCKSTPWPGAGRMSGNLFEGRNWLLPPNYVNNGNNNTTVITSPKSPIKEEPKTGEQSIITPKQRNVDGDQIVPSARIRKRKIGMANTETNFNRRYHPSQKYKDPKQDALRP